MALNIPCMQLLKQQLGDAVANMDPAMLSGAIDMQMVGGLLSGVHRRCPYGTCVSGPQSQEIAALPILQVENISLLSNSAETGFVGVNM